MRTEKNLAASASGLLARRFYPVAVVVVTALAVSLLTRLVLLLTQSGWHEATPGQILAALAVGEVFDLVAALWLALGLTVYLTLLPERFWRSRFHHRFLLLNLAVFFFAMLFVGVIEFYFFAEFNGRFNFVAVDYLMFPTEVGENIWQSYPTGKVILVLAAVSAGLIFALRGRLHRAWQAAYAPGARPEAP
ncbi:MAG TPA: hypothetical protein PK413_06485, partial [Thermoanaerobaculia bacterium]|nr:hypothetical protein [Thermoanaerobaculia bacterium]